MEQTRCSLPLRVPVFQLRARFPGERPNYMVGFYLSCWSGGTKLGGLAIVLLCPILTLRLLRNFSRKWRLLSTLSVALLLRVSKSSTYWPIVYRRWDRQLQHPATCFLNLQNSMACFDLGRLTSTTHFPIYPFK